jgi:hypothetical protein
VWVVWVDEHLPKSKKINVWVGGFGVDEHLPKTKKPKCVWHVSVFGGIKAQTNCLFKDSCVE